MNALGRGWAHTPIALMVIGFLGALDAFESVNALTLLVGGFEEGLAGLEGAVTAIPHAAVAVPASIGLIPTVALAALMVPLLWCAASSPMVVPSLANAARFISLPDSDSRCTRAVICAGASPHGPPA